MRKLLNTLHVMTQGMYLHRDGETISAKLGSDLKLRIPVHTLEGLVCWGQVSCSPPLLGLCCEKGVGVSFLSEQGRFVARVQGPISGNVLLRRQQYRMADGAELALPVVRSIVTAKIANSRIVLLRAARETGEEPRQRLLREAANRLSWIGLEASGAASVDEARGHEGLGGQAYFSAFDAMVAGDREAGGRGGRRSPRGERGLKHQVVGHKGDQPPRRSPRGERGLKLTRTNVYLTCEGSLPTRGAWIETGPGEEPASTPTSLPTRGAWIETWLLSVYHPKVTASLPTRGAWIETFLPHSPIISILVAPHAGSVD